MYIYTYAINILKSSCMYLFLRKFMVNWILTNNQLASKRRNIFLYLNICVFWFALFMLVAKLGGPSSLCTVSAWARVEQSNPSTRKTCRHIINHLIVNHIKVVLFRTHMLYHFFALIIYYFSMIKQIQSPFKTRHPWDPSWCSHHLAISTSWHPKYGLPPGAVHRWVPGFRTNIFWKKRRTLKNY